MSSTSNHSLSPRILPKLKFSGSSKILRENLNELTSPTAHNSSSLILELERRLIEQRKELMNRDTAVKKIIYNFEAMVEAHSDEKLKNSEIRLKYMQKQNEIKELTRINEELNKLVNKDMEQRRMQEEEMMKGEIESLKDQVERRNAELRGKSALIATLENELDNSKREINRLHAISKKVKEDQELKYSNNEIREMIERTRELESDLRAKEEILIECQNQIVYLKENNNTVIAELQATKHSMNTLRKNYLKLKEDNEAEMNTNKSEANKEQGTEKYISVHRIKIEAEKTMSKQMKITEGAENIQDIKKRYNKEQNVLLNSLNEQTKINDTSHKTILDLKESLRKMEESNILLSERNKYIEKDLSASKDQAVSYKKKYEEGSVEIKLLKETLLYKDEKIKRDAERVKMYQHLEQDLSKLKYAYKELEESCKQYQYKIDRSNDTLTHEKLKWSAKESSYVETINNLVKDMNNLKKDEQDSESMSNSVKFTNKLLDIENEAKSLKKELQEATKKEQDLGMAVKNYAEKISRIEMFIHETEGILRCSNCFSSSKPLGIYSPCSHLVCKDCTENRCKECFSNISLVLKPVFLESIPMILAQVKSIVEN